MESMMPIKGSATIEMPHGYKVTQILYIKIEVYETTRYIVLFELPVHHGME